MHWYRPSDAPVKDYDLDKGSKVPGAVSGMRITEMTWGRIMIYGKGDDKVVSSNVKIVPEKGIDVGARQSNDTHLVRLYGRLPGKCKIHAGVGTFGTPSWEDWTTPLDVEVVKWQPEVFLFKLTEPHMTLNSHDTPVPYQMKYTEAITKNTPIDDVFAKVTAAAGKEKGGLKHLAFSSHGSPGKIWISGQNSGQVLDSSNVDKFFQLNGKVKIIWIVSCQVCGGSVGDTFAEAIAEKAGCHVVALELSAFKTGLKLGKGEIDLHLRWMPKGFTPKQGTKILISDLPLLGGMEVVPKTAKKP